MPALNPGRPWARRWRRPDDRGAVAVTFAILVASGVLLGALALAVDVGRLYVERGELQHGADSAALAIARSCAQREPACASVPAMQPVAQRYADGNTADGSAAVTKICGRLPFGTVDCGPTPDNLTACLGDPPPGRYVEVHVSTGSLEQGSTVLPPTFAQAVAGGDDGTIVAACARAVWDISVLAVTIHECVYDAALGQNHYVIKFWRWQYPLAGVFDTPPCRSPGADDVEPKIAGLLNGADADCEIDLDGGDILGRFRENEAYWHFPDTCRDLILEHWRTGDPLYIPVFSRIANESDDGETASFRQVFVAPFIVTAFQVGIPPGWFSIGQIGYDPNDYRRPTNGSLPCGTNELGFRCLAGYFSGDPIPVDELTGDNRIRLVG